MDIGSTGKISRRGFLGGAGAVGVGLLASACGGGSSNDTGGSQGGSSPSATGGGGAGTGSTAPSAGSSTPKKLSGTVEFWTVNLKKNYNDYITGLINDFKKMQPNVSINWVDVPGPDIATKFLASLASHKPADAVNLPDVNARSFIPKLANLSDYFDASELAAYTPGLVKAVTQGDEVYAIPWYNGGPRVGIYNMSLMDKAGFDPKSPPSNWDDVLTLAQKVYDTTKVYGIGDDPTPRIMHYYGQTLLSADGKKTAFDTAALTEILNKFKKAYDDHGIAPGFTPTNSEDAPQSIDKGNLAFVPEAQPFQLLNYKKNAPNVYSKLGVSEAVKTNDGSVVLQAQQTFVIPKESKNPEAAAAFIGYVTNAANQLAFCKIVNIFPSTLESMKDPFFATPQGTELPDQARVIAVKEFPNMTQWSLPTDQVAKLETEWTAVIQGFLQGQHDVKSTLSSIESQWNKALAG